MRYIDGEWVRREIWRQYSYGVSVSRRLHASLHGDLLVCPEAQNCLQCARAATCAEAVICARRAALRRERFLRSRGPGRGETPWDPWEAER